MPKFRSLEIVDDVGTRKLLLDGDLATPGDATLGLYHPLREVTWPLLAASVDSFIWTIHEGVWQLAYAKSVITVSGGTSAAVTVVWCGGTPVAIGSGTAQLTAALDLEETAPNKQVGTLITTPTLAYPGDSYGVDFSGTLTGLVGVLSLGFRRVK